jgi:hypothetical protein
MNIYQVDWYGIDDDGSPLGGSITIAAKDTDEVGDRVKEILKERDTKLINFSIERIEE